MRGGSLPTGDNPEIEQAHLKVTSAKVTGRTGISQSAPIFTNAYRFCMAKTNTRIRPGVAFRDGKLFIFGNSQILVIRQWPDIRAWRKSEQHGWHTWRPQIHPRLIRLHEPHFKTARTPEQADQIASWDGHDFRVDEWIQYKVRRQRKFAEAAWRFSEPIPPEVRRAVRSFDESRYEVLQAFAVVDYALELYRSNPTLFYALIRNDQFFVEPPRARLAACRRFILHKQHEISKWLGFPEDAGKVCVRILSKLPSRDVRIHRLWWLRRMLADPELRKLFVFAPRVDATVIGFVWDAKELLHPSLAAKLVQRMETKALFQARLIVRDIFRMWRLLERPWPPAKKICGVNAFEDLHDELWRSCERRVSAAGLKVRFPEPPLPEWPDIELLGTTKEIIAEGEEMDHCVASYIPEMTAGERPILLYRVLWPERATLRLTKPGEKWRLAELRCRRNQEPSPETFQFVRTWLHETQKMVELGFPQMADGSIDPELCPF